MRDAEVTGEAKSFAFLLLLLACWTVCLKYIAPIVWALLNQTSLLDYVMWDAWPIVHVAIAILFLRQLKIGWWLAALTAASELIIIAVKLRAYFLNPIADFWKINWAVNKIVLFVYFIFLIFWLCKPRVKAAFLR